VYDLPFCSLSRFIDGYSDSLDWSTLAEMFLQLILGRPKVHVFHENRSFVGVVAWFSYLRLLRGLQLLGLGGSCRRRVLHTDIWIRRKLVL